MKHIRWGLIGCGDVAYKFIGPAIVNLKCCELTAASSLRGKTAEAFTGNFEAQRWYTRWQDLIIDDEIDAVYVAWIAMKRHVGNSQVVVSRFVDRCREHWIAAAVHLIDWQFVSLLVEN